MNNWIDKRSTSSCFSSEWTSRRDYTRIKLPGPQYLYSVRLSVCLSCLKPKFDQLFCLSCLDLRCPRTNKKLHSALCSSPFTKQRWKFSMYVLLIFQLTKSDKKKSKLSVWSLFDLAWICNVRRLYSFMEKKSCNRKHFDFLIFALTFSVNCYSTC